MKNFIVYIASGQIVRHGTCQDELISMQALENEFSIEADYQQNTYIENGILVQMPEKPVGDYIFDYQSKAWVFDSVSAAATAIIQRNYLLQSSDWTQLPDVPLSDKEAWAEYRQQLRDLTSQPDFPNVIIWPIPPMEA